MVSSSITGPISSKTRRGVGRSAPFSEGSLVVEQGVAPVLRASGVSKRFGAVVALEDVGIEVVAGEIAGLVGDNGAGKSTLIKIISAVLRPDAGTIELDGQPQHFASPAAARATGIETVYQDLA